jgi:predicted DCC family thiol-disulfide oxidoreductase YuxK
MQIINCDKCNKELNIVTSIMVHLEEFRYDLCYDCVAELRSTIEGEKNKDVIKMWLNKSKYRLGED